MRKTLTHGGAVLLCCSGAAAPASEPVSERLRGPSASRNLAPIYANLGIPTLADARIPEAGSWQAGWTLHWASHSVQTPGERRSVEFDGETRRHDFQVLLGLGSGFSLSANLPFVRHSAGSLDSLIDGWHGFWGMPEGDRPGQPRDRLRFEFSGENGFLLDRPTAGIGDAELELAARLIEREHRALSAFARIKLDTGDARDMTGSGHTGYSAGVRYRNDRCAMAALSCHLQAGVAQIGDIEFDPAADSSALFASLSLVWEFIPSLALAAQLDVHEPIYATAPLAEDGAPVWGTLGLRWAAGRSWIVEAQFNEDLNVGTAPDITFILGVSRGF